MKNILPVVLLIIVFISCTKERGVVGPAGPQGPPGAAGTGSGDDTGTIAGRLSLYDEFSHNTGTGADVLVTLTSGSLKLVDTTDVMGAYRFSGMKTGTYNLTYQKTGYGTMKVLSVSHFAGGAAPTSVNEVIMVQIPIKTAPDSLGLYVNNGSYTYFSVRLDTSSFSYVENSLNIEVFVSKDKNVNSLNYQYKITNIGTDGLGGYVAILSGDVNNPLPFKHGDVLYAVAYTYNSYVNLTNGVHSFIKYITEGGTYTDPETGATTYPNLSKPSNVLKFTF